MLRKFFMAVRLLPSNTLMPSSVPNHIRPNLSWYMDSTDSCDNPSLIDRCLNCMAQMFVVIAQAISIRNIRFVNFMCNK